MNTDELRYFIEAAKEQNLSRAAKTLGTTQSTLSHAIKRLEREFDCQLFSRSGKNLKLTNEGRRFSERALELTQHIRNLKTEVSSGRTAIVGSMKVAGTLGMPVNLLARGLTRLTSSENAVLEIKSLRSAEILKAVAAKQIDFGFCFDPQPYPQLKIRKIATSDSIAVVRKGHPVLKLKKQDRILNLTKYPWAHPTHLPGVVPCTTHPLFKKMGIQPKIKFNYDSFDIAIETVLGKDAWAFLPSAFAKQHAKTLTPFFPELTEPISLNLIWHEEGEEFVAEQLALSLRKVAEEAGWRTLESLH